mgnify:CR=1 FL=1
MCPPIQQYLAVHYDYEIRCIMMFSLLETSIVMPVANNYRVKQIVMHDVIACCLLLWTIAISKAEVH